MTGGDRQPGGEARARDGGRRGGVTRLNRGYPGAGVASEELFTSHFQK